jgi:hypothetical protein
MCVIIRYVLLFVLVSCVVCIYLIDFMMKDKHGPETAFELRTTFGYTGR